MLFFIGCVFPYLAAACFIFGLTRKLYRWLAVPLPFPLTAFPAPGNPAGRLMVWLKELFLFDSLFRHNKLLWLFGWIMHLALGFIIVGHVFGIYFLGQQFTVIGLDPGTSRVLSHFFGTVAGWVLIISLLVLLGRRLYDPEVRVISDMQNYFELALLAAIAFTGMELRWGTNWQEVALVKEYVAGLVRLHPVLIPVSPWFWWHFSLVNVLVMYLPYTRLVHWLGGGLLRMMLTEPPPVYPTGAGKPLRSPFAGSTGHDPFAPAKSTMIKR